MLSSKTTLWLFILLVLVSAAAWFEKQHLPSGGFGAMPSSVVSIEVASIHQLVVETTNTTITCSRNQNHWEIKTPIRCRADSTRIDFVLEMIARTPPRDRVSPRQRKNRRLSLKDYGLVVPKAVVSLEGREGTSTLRIGLDTPSGDGVFVMASRSDDIYIVDRVLLDLLPKSVEDFRDRALIPAASDIVGIEIRQPGKDIVNLVKTASIWNVTRPFEIDASMPAVNALLASLKNATIEKFVWTSSKGQTGDGLLEDASTSLGITADEYKLSTIIQFANGTSANFNFGSINPDSPEAIYVISSLDNSIFTVDKNTINALQMDADFLRERRVFPFLASKVLAASCNSVDTSFALHRNDTLSAWTISRPSVQPTDQAAAAKLIEELLRIEGKDVIPMSEEEGLTLEKGGMETVKIEITPVPPLEIITAFATIKRDDNGIPVTFDIAVPEKKLRYRIPAETLPTGFLEPGWFASTRDKTILSVPTAMLSAITRRIGTREETAILGRDAEWFSTKPLPISANKTSLNALATLFTNFEAQRVSSLFSADTNGYGLNPPSIEFIITTKISENPVVIVLVGNTLADGSAYIKVKGRDAVFLASPEDVTLLSHALTTEPSN